MQQRHERFLEVSAHVTAQFKMTHKVVTLAKRDEVPADYSNFN